MSLLSDIEAIDALARAQGSSIAMLLGRHFQDAFGIDCRLRAPTGDATVNASSMEEVKLMLQALQQALDALNAQVAQDKSLLDGVVTYIKGVPDLVANAVSQALANSGVDQANIAQQVNDARQTVQASIDTAVQAVQVNTVPPTPANPTGDSTAPAATADPTAEADPTGTPTTGS